MKTSKKKTDREKATLIGVHLDPVSYQQFKEKCDVQERTMSSQLRYLIKQYLAK